MPTLKDILMDGASRGEIPEDVVAEEFDRMRADAQRFRGLRLILTERDKAKQVAMLDAMEKFMSQQPEMDEDNAPTVTAERVNEIADQLILAAHGARNADG